MGKRILQAELTDLVEPGFRGGSFTAVDILCMSVQYTCFWHSCDHAKDRELPEVDTSSSRKSTGQEVNERLRS